MCLNKYACNHVVYIICWAVNQRTQNTPWYHATKGSECYWYQYRWHPDLVWIHYVHVDTPVSRTNLVGHKHIIPKVSHGILFQWGKKLSYLSTFHVFYFRYGFSWNDHVVRVHVHVLSVEVLNACLHGSKKKLFYKLWSRDLGMRKNLSDSKLVFTW